MPKFFNPGGHEHLSLPLFITCSVLYHCELPVFYVSIQIMLRMSNTVDLKAQKLPATEGSWSHSDIQTFRQIKKKDYVRSIFKDLSTTSGE